MADNHRTDLIDDLSTMTTPSIDYDDSEVETSSSCSYEETAAKIERVLRRTLKLDDPVDDNLDQKCASPREPLAIDAKSLPGYQEIPANCPTWKRTLIVKKNKQLEELAMQELIAKKQEEDRWRNVPEWKKALILVKERRKNEEMQHEMRMRESQVVNLDSLPEWKRSLVLKKLTSSSDSS